MAAKKKPSSNQAAPPTAPVEQPVEVVEIVEEKLAVTLRTDVGYEYHLDLPRSVVKNIVDPETPDVRIEVPCPLANTRRFLHTSYIKEVDVRGYE